MSFDESETMVSDGKPVQLELKHDFMVAVKSKHRNPDRQVYRFYFQVPARYLREGCDVASTPLGDDLERANATAAILHAAFERWKRDRHKVRVEGRVAFGTFDWLAGEYMRTEHYLTRSPSTRRSYKGDLTQFADTRFPGGELKGMRLGDVRLDRLTRPRISNLIDGLLVTKQVDFGGKALTVRCGARARNFVSSACTAWNVMSVKVEHPMFAANPFERHRIEQHTKPNVAASLDESRAFVAAADRLGLPVVGTIILTSFELRWRPTHVIDLLRVENYRPPDRPDEVLILDTKNLDSVWRPLFDDDGEPLYPMLTERLDALKGDRTSGHMFTQGQVLGEEAETPDAAVNMDWLRKRVDKVAALVEGRRLTLTNFRHGGITEMAEASVTEQQMMSHTLHKDPRTMTKYVKKTTAMQLNAQLAVLEHREKRRKAKARREGKVRAEGRPAKAVALLAAHAAAGGAAATRVLAAPGLGWTYGASWKVVLT